MKRISNILILMVSLAWCGFVGYQVGWAAGVSVGVLYFMVLGAYFEQKKTQESVLNIQKLYDENAGHIARQLQAHDNRLSQVEAVVLKNQFKVRPH